MSSNSKSCAGFGSASSAVSTTRSWRRPAVSAARPTDSSLPRRIAVIGGDLDREYVEYGRRRCIRLVEGDVKRLIELGAKADLVIVNHLLEHVADPIDFLLDLREIVKDEGHVLIGVPGLADVRYGYGDGEFWGCLQNAHLFFFELWTLKRCMERAGFGFVDGYEGIQ